MTGDPTLPAARCADIEPLLAVGIFGSLDGEQRRSLADHLERCPGCRALSAELARNPVGGALVDEGMVAGDDFAELRVVATDNYVRGEEIGRGGMGRVVRARDRRLGRSVVLKELLDARLRERFEQEARLTARLQHPAIVNVHEAGRWPSGDSFYAMKHVAGQPLDRAIDARRTLADRLALLPNLITVVEAIAYAHSQRVIHRDIKPANIIVGPFGETVVIDWGLAKDLARDEGAGESPYRGGITAFTVAGAGTPSYMPPEQAEGRSSDERVDVFALGATLHHLLAGAPPERAPLPPDAPRALVAIVRKAMARDPRDRYPTAGALVEELRRFQGGQLVAAHSYSLREHLERFVRRNRTLVAAAALSLAALAAVAGVSLQKVLEARRRAEAQLAELLLERGREELAGGMPSRALAYLAEAQTRGLDTPALRALVGDAARPFDELIEQIQLPAHPVAARFAPDGSRLLVVDAGGDVVLWDVAARRPTVLAHDGRPGAPLAFAPDGSSVLAASGDTVRVWSAADGSLRGVLPHGQRVESARYLGPSAILTVAGLAATTWQPGGAPIAAIRLSSHRQMFVTASADGRDLVALETGGERMPVARVPVELAGGEAMTWQLVFRRRGRGLAQLVALAPDGEAELIVAAGSATAELRRSGLDAPTLQLRHGAPIIAARFDDSGKVALTASRDGMIRLWEVETGVEAACFDALGVPVAARLDGDGHRLLAVSDDGTVRVWKRHGRLVAMRVHTIGWDRAVFGPDGSLAAVTGAGDVQIIDRNGRNVGATTSTPGTLPAFVDGGRGVLLAGLGGIVAWDTARELRLTSPAVVAPRAVSRLGLVLGGDGMIRNRGGVVVAAVPGLRPSLSSDGRLVAGMLDDGERAAVWDAASGRLLHELAVEHNPTRVGDDVVVAPSGELMTTVISERRLAVWDTRSGRRRADLVSPGAIEHVLFSPDSGSVLVAGAGAGATVFGVDGETRLDLPALAVTSVAFAPDGARILVGERDGAARVWDTATGMLLETLGPLPEPVTEVAFAPDGTRALAVAGNHLAVWDTRLSTRSPAEVARLAAALPLRLDGGRLTALPHSSPVDERPPREARARASYEQGMTLYARGKYGAAIGRYAAAVKDDPRPEYTLAMAYALNSLSGPRIAAAGDRLPDDFKSRFEWGQDLYEQRRYHEAADMFLSAYEIRRAASLLYNAAVCYEKERRYRDAAALFKRYLDEAQSPRDRAAIEMRIAALTSEAERAR